jgi:hypothetical protein
MAGIGPVPKAASRRRRRTPPRTYGAATPVTAPAAGAQDRELGLEDPHPLVVSMWENIQKSCEATFYSEADFARLRMELWNANEVMRNPRPTAWQQVQRGLSDMLISPAAKRRCAIEMKAAGPDEDADAAVSMLSGYRDKLKPV